MECNRETRVHQSKNEGSCLLHAIGIKQVDFRIDLSLNALQGK